jgi:hypothetical protein
LAEEVGMCEILGMLKSYVLDVGCG